VAAIIGQDRTGVSLARRLRIRLWAEHLGVPPTAVTDPITSKSLWAIPSPTKRVAGYVTTGGTDPWTHALIPYDVIDPPFPVPHAACCAIHGPSCPGAPRRGVSIPVPALESGTRLEDDVLVPTRRLARAPAKQG
jgi:hypothetical protein